MVKEEMIIAIRAGKSERDKAIKALYHNQLLQNGIKKIVLSNSGTEQDYRQILSYAVVEFMKKCITAPSFTVTSSIENYIIGIAKFLWLQELRKKRKDPQRIPEGYSVEDPSPRIDLLIANEEVKKSLHVILSKLGRNCKEVLMMWASGNKMKEIAKKLDYNSEGVVRKKKFKCMKELLDYLDANPGIKKSLSK